MSAHTIGPWSVGHANHPDYAAIGIHDGEDFIIADICPDAPGDQTANARLIAAAPELLAALEAIVKSLSDHDDEGMIEHVEPMIAARAAIAKATGEKP